MNMQSCRVPLFFVTLVAALAVPAAVAEPPLSPIFGVGIPDGFRQWPVIAVSQEVPFNEFRAITGNPIAMQAYRAGTLPFPDGTVIAKIAWERVESTEFPGAFVPGTARTLQFMVKDSKKYPDTGGWGFGRFLNGKAADLAQHQTCFACHQANVKGHDFVFTRLAK